MNGSVAALDKDLGDMEGPNLAMGQYHDAVVKKANGKGVWIDKCISCTM